MIGLKIEIRTIQMLQHDGCQSCLVAVRDTEQVERLCASFDEIINGIITGICHAGNEVVFMHMLCIHIAAQFFPQVFVESILHPDAVEEGQVVQPEENNQQVK
jgi:hypothetical protein